MIKSILIILMYISILSANENINNNIKVSTILDKSNLEKFRFDLIKKGKDNNNTLLIIGGIQGDEAGGFMAASLISTHYNITKGSVWIVPNLNFYSIIKRSRGPFGDMNRKFSILSKKDPEYNTIQRIKRYIKAPTVKLILNLHDGSGFYRPMYIDKNHQPNKWGQSLVIDQEILPNCERYNDVYTISHKVTTHINKHLLKKEDKYRTKNTHTRFNKTYEEKEMAKTLTYFAINNNKSAFGHETSKSLNVAQRVYYKLLAIEKFMDIMGIKYTKKFKLNIKDIKRVLNDDIYIRFHDINLTLPLKDIKNIQNFFPVNKDKLINFVPSNPLIKIIRSDNIYTIYYGNRRLTRLKADYKSHINFKTKVDFIIDGVQKSINLGDTIDVKDNFIVKDNSTFRVNIIGYKSKDNIETNKVIKKRYILKRYAIKKNGNLFRVEFYKNNNFVGMILVNFL